MSILGDHLGWLMVAGVTAVAMEGWAAVLHGGLWHRGLWFMHRSHHRRPGDVAAGEAAGGGGWEANDVLSLLHAPVAVALVVAGCEGDGWFVQQICFGAGVGMSAFGVAYTLVHDGFAHGRLPLKVLERFRFMRRVRAAHRVHHRLGGAPFGLFSGPWVLRWRGQAGRAGTSRARGRRTAPAASWSAQRSAARGPSARQATP